MLRPDFSWRYAPDCDRCGGETAFAASVPRLGAIAGVRFFVCRACGSIIALDSPSPGTSESDLRLDR
jgi:hypothetical protein